MSTNFKWHVQVCILYPFLHINSSLGLPSIWLPTNMVSEFQASGGSTLLNLDFFGPVDDTSSGIATTIPGQQSAKPGKFNLLTFLLKKKKKSMSHVM